MSEQVPSNPVPAVVPSAPVVEPSAPLSIFRTWLNALTRPQLSTYAAIAASPNATRGTAFLWIVIASLVQAFVVLLVGSGEEAGLLQALGGSQNSTTVDLGARITQMVCVVPLTVIFALLGFAFTVWLTNLVARAFGGHATFDQMTYTYAAIAVPFSLVLSAIDLMGVIPYIGQCFLVLTIPLGLYGLALYVMAVKAVHEVSWGGAIMSSIGVPFILGLGVACVTIVALMIFGPIIGNVFSSINSSLPAVP